MPSFEVTIEVDEASAEDLSGELFSLGAEAIELRDREGLKLPGVILPPEGKAWLICGFAGDSREALEARLVNELATLGWPYRLDKVVLRDDTDWAHKWKEFYKPLKVGRRLWVSPSWETMPEVSDAVVIRLDPEMAFGTGQHPTTRLCLRATEQLLDARKEAQKRMKLLDVGTGSGILAIGAALLGANDIIGIDNDEVSVETAKQNAARNGVAAACRFSLGAMPQATSFVGGPFDVILANILADPLVEMASSLVGLLAPGGDLVLSGLLTDQAERVGAAYTALGLSLVAHEREEEWSALVFAAAPA